MEKFCGDGPFSRFLGLDVASRRRIDWTWQASNGSMIRMDSSSPKTRIDCIIELTNIVVTIVAFFLPLFVVIRYKCNTKLRSNSRLLPLHNIRSMLCIVLLILLLFDIADGIYEASILLPILSFFVTVICWLAHRTTEVQNGLAVVLTAGSFMMLAIARISRLLYMRRLNMTLRHARVVSTGGIATICGLLAIVDMFTLYKLIQRPKKFVVRQDPIDQTSYRHNSATLLSRLTFHWVVELLGRGYANPRLDVRDLGELPKEERTRVQFEKFLKIYKAEEASSSVRRLSLWRCYWKRIWSGFLIGCILKFFGDATSLVGPIAISGIIDYVAAVQNGTQNGGVYDYEAFLTVDRLIKNGYFLGLLVFLAAILQSTLSQASTHVLNVQGIHLRTALQALIYDKAFRVCSWNIAEDDKISEDGVAEDEETQEQSKAHQAPDIGTLTNLMAEDVYNVMNFFCMGHYTWAIPLKIFAIIFLLYLKLGISAIIGAVCCIFIVTPMQLFLVRKVTRNSKAMAERSDARLRLMNEVLQGMRLIKIRAWEDIFDKKIEERRNGELRFLDRESLYWALITFLTQATSILMTLFTFGIYFWTETRHLDAGSVFASLALFSQLTVPLFIFPIVVPTIITARLSTKRLEDFLRQPETVNILPDQTENAGKLKSRRGTDADGSKRESSTVFGCLDDIDEGEEDRYSRRSVGDDSTIASSLDNVFERETSVEPNVVSISGLFSWGTEDNQLRVDNLSLPRGKLTLIVGRVGSGKTSLLSAMLGEIHMIRGKVEWAKDTSVAYVAQKPWLQNATIKENILFGADFHPSRYRSVLRACELQTDVEALPGKDETIIGEKGINLSGGQKQRITIARALYSKANTIIMDNPLSALDQQVSQQVFRHAIKKLALGRGCTVIMATHRLELLPEAEQIVAVEGCKIRAVGSKSFIETSDPELAEQWREDARRQDEKLKPPKTARHHWSLVKMVSKLGISVKHGRDSEGSWDDRDGNAVPSFVPLKKRRSTLLGSSYLAHDLADLPVPSEEWTVVRRPSKKHKPAVRATSLQPTKPQIPVLRLHSTPTILEDHSPLSKKRHHTMDNGQQNMLKQFFSVKSPSQEWENHNPGRRLLSTESGCTEDTEDLDDRSLALQDAKNPEYEDNTGLVTSRVWLKYIRSGGIAPGIVYVGAALGWQALRVYTDLWLSRWTDESSDSGESPDGHSDMSFYFEMYIALSIGSILLAGGYSAAGQWSGARARRRLHVEAVTGVLEAPLSFFDATPIGGILDKFSADMGVIDKKLSSAVQRTTAFILLCGSAMVVNVIISPWFLVAAVPTCIAYFLLQRFFRISAKQLQRLDGTTRGPAAAHFSETLAGLTTLRVSKQQKRFTDEMLDHLDANINAYLILNTSNRWLGIALDYLAGVIVAASIFAAILSAKMNPESITPALVGLAVNYTLLVPIYLNWVVKYVSDTEMYMNSVVRLNTFERTAREEYREDGLQVADNWPQKGEIRFENVSLRYDAEKEPVVSRLSLSVPSGQKLGICGRTGSGKSSTAMALFQFVDVCAGRIFIDDVNIGKVPLRILRERLGAIPQDVVLFSGTIRKNLDPRGKHGDDEIWAALELAQMKEIVKSNPEGLDTEVREGGENLSAGERQLLSMARAALLQSSIVVLDEATSALDRATEKLLLKAAEAAFKDKTVITIAHRVASLLDCDRVIVFDAGQVVEDGKPQELRRRPEGFFAKMLQASESTDSKANGAAKNDHPVIMAKRNESPS